SVLLDGTGGRGTQQACDLLGRWVGGEGAVGVDAQVQVHSVGVKSMRRSKKRSAVARPRPVLTREQGWGARKAVSSAVWFGPRTRCLAVVMNVSRSRARSS